MPPQARGVNSQSETSRANRARYVRYRTKCTKVKPRPTRPLREPLTGYFALAALLVAAGIVLVNLRR